MAGAMIPVCAITEKWNSSPDFIALAVVGGLAGWAVHRRGRDRNDSRKELAQHSSGEAMATVALGWLGTVLRGALPLWGAT